MTCFLHVVNRGTKTAVLILAAVAGMTSLSLASQDFAEQEADAMARQAAEQELARQAVPFVSGLIFRGLDPEDNTHASCLVFEEGRLVLANGKLTAGGPSCGYAFHGVRSPNEQDRLRDPVNQWALLAWFKLMALSAILGWPLAAFLLRGTMYVDDIPAPTLGSRFFRSCGWVANVLVLAVMIVLFLLSVRRPELWPGGYRLDLPQLRPLVTFLAAALALGLLGSVLAWSKPYWRVPGRFHYTLTILSGMGFLWYLHQCGVLEIVWRT